MMIRSRDAKAEAVRRYVTLCRESIDVVGGDLASLILSTLGWR